MSTATCCNHDCNQGRTYPERKHTCDELGVCQRQRILVVELPAGCDPDAETQPPGKYPFAPGTIDGPDNMRRPTVRDVFIELACLAMAIAAAGFAAGYLATKLGWLV